MIAGDYVHDDDYDELQLPTDIASFTRGGIGDNSGVDGGDAGGMHDNDAAMADVEDDHDDNIYHTKMAANYEELPDHDLEYMQHHERAIAAEQHKQQTLGVKLESLINT